MAEERVAVSRPRYHERRNFAKIPEVMEPPNLIAVQTESFRWLLGEGLDEAFEDVSPIESKDNKLMLEFGKHEFGDPKHSIEECKEKNITYQASLLVDARFVNKETGEVKEQKIFLGDFPLMTDSGTFIINGTERVVVSQLGRSPGVYFKVQKDKPKTPNQPLYEAQFIPSRGAWLEFTVKEKQAGAYQLEMEIDRRSAKSATLLLRALGIAETDEEIIDLLGDDDIVLRTLARDADAGVKTRQDALARLFSLLRPGEPVELDAAHGLLDNMFSDPKRYDLATVGRYKINKRLGLDVPEECLTLTEQDIVSAIRYLIELQNGVEGHTSDEIDHFGNRRVRTVGELVQNQFRNKGLARIERTVRDRMSMQEVDEITPQSLINIRPITAAIKEFFSSSQLSQFMDQTNPAAAITNKRRLSALGHGGLTRETSKIEVRDVHSSHYGRMCPIETPEGQNIGLIGSLATYARINSLGFVEAPYRRVVDGKVTDDIDYLTADEEENYIIAQANDPFDQKTRLFGTTDPKTGEFVPSRKVLCRVKDVYGDFGMPEEVEPDRVNYMDVSPRQMVSVATALIPFLEHDDANRALMGSNMQRQAVPLLRPHAPLVGTGMEHRCAVDSGESVIARNSGVIDYVDSSRVVVRRDDDSTETYHLQKFKRSNQGGCINQKPIVATGQEVEAGDVLADGPACEMGDLALGQNLLVAYMPWEGYNYEDAIIISERVVQEDLLTSIHIAEYELDARDTKLGPEEITREIPNMGEEMLANLDIDGIVRVGAEVFPGDVLVGKVTPKGETELTAEERLLRAIFGEKAREVRDTSLKMPHGASGRVIGITRFSRAAGDELSPSVNELVRVYVAQRRKVQQGDKLSGRHGNKGVISRILPIEDMPYLADGTPVDIIMNPLGVPSRMNVGQLLETHLGWAARLGWDDNDEEIVDGPVYVATPTFDGATEEEICRVIELANHNLKRKVEARLGEHTYEAFIPQLSSTGKTELFDGRTGEKFREPITVGQKYILKLSHMVDDKIHARSTGPYSLVTQQPLGGKAQFGGQRFGEMEVWALHSYGAANVLQEILTIKSDDTAGRVNAYEAIVKGENVPEPELPESFKVLVRELKSLCLNIELLGDDNEKLDLLESSDEDDRESTKKKQEEETLIGAPSEDKDAASDIDLITSDLSDLDLSGELGERIDEIKADDDDVLIGAPRPRNDSADIDKMLGGLMSDEGQADDSEGSDGPRSAGDNDEEGEE